MGRTKLRYTKYPFDDIVKNPCGFVNTTFERWYHASLKTSAVVDGTSGHCSFTSPYLQSWVVNRHPHEYRSIKHQMKRFRIRTDKISTIRRYQILEA